MIKDNGDVISIQQLGSMEAGVSNASASELLMYGLANLSEEPGYAVHHGWQPVSDFGYRPGTETDVASLPTHNFWTLAFPTLFPYGEGGIEEPRPVYVRFNEHIQYCLSHHSR